MGKDNDSENSEVRLDKWLWAARFYKTRNLAVEAISGGKVHLNGGRVKPAHVVRLGDMLTIRKGRYEQEVQIQQLSKKRGPAKEAGTLYVETEDSKRKRSLLAEQIRLTSSFIHPAGKKPTKKERRQLLRFTGKT